MITTFETDLSIITMDQYLSLISGKDVNSIIKRRGYDFFFDRRKMKERLKDAIRSIIQAYQDLSKDNNASAFFMLTKEKYVLTNEIQIGRALVISLYMQYNEDIVRVLKKCGYKFPFTKKSYIKDCKKVESLLKNKYLRLSKVDKELIPFTEGKELEGNEYIELATVLSKFQGYKIDLRLTSVSEFISIFNNYKQWLTTKK